MAKRTSSTPKRHTPKDRAATPAASSAATTSSARSATTKSTARPAVTREMIAKRAYEIYASGKGGSAEENWRRAEAELRA